MNNFFCFYRIFEMILPFLTLERIMLRWKDWMN